MQRFLDIGLRESRATERSPSRTFLLWALPCAVWLAILYFGEVRIERWPNEVSGYPAFRDFVNLWSGAIAALHHQFGVLFDRNLHDAEIGRLLAIPPPPLIWSYPPTALLPVLPLALLPYSWACAAWSLSGLIAYFLAAGVSTVARRDRLAWLTAIALCPGVFTCFMYGQTAFLTSAALITGVRVAQRRPVVAGACFALLAAKPQIALVVPVVLAAIGAWRTLAATVLFVGIYVGATVAAFGVEPWQRFIDSTLPQQFAILNSAHIKAVMMISPYFLFRGLGLPLSASYGLQLCLSLVAVGWLFVSIRHERDVNVRILMVACAVLVASAYLQTYELPLLVAAVARICASEESSSHIGTIRLNLICASVTVAPLAVLLLAVMLGINFTPLIPLALLAGLGWTSLSRTNLLKFPGLPLFRERGI